VRQANKLYLLFFKFKNDGEEFLVVDFVISLSTLKSFRIKCNKVLLSVKGTLL
jgi:hypothetical protein